MNILLLPQVMGSSVRPIVPIGLVSIATYLEHASDHQVRVFDPNVEADWRLALRDVLAEHKPDLIGVSFRNIDSTLYLDRVNYFPALKRLVKHLRAACPRASIVVGGAGVAVFGDQIMSLIPEVDACVSGPGEESMLRIADTPGQWKQVPGCIYRADDGRGIVHSAAPRRLSFASLPHPRRDFVPMARYLAHPNAVGVLTKQGCARQCIYCMYPLTSGRKVDARAPEHVVEELAYLARDFGVEHVYIADNQFNEPVASMTAVCEAIIRSGVKMRWTAFFNCFRHGFNRDILDLVKRAGCVCVQATPEAYPQRYLDIFGKYSEDDVRAFIDVFREERDVEALIDFFADAPGQRVDDFLKMLWFVGRQVVGAALRRTPVTFKLHALRLYPDTPMFDRAVETGYIARDADLLTESEHLDKSLFYLTPSRRLAYDILLVASRLVGYRTPDYRER